MLIVKENGNPIGRIADDGTPLFATASFQRDFQRLGQQQLRLNIALDSQSPPLDGYATVLPNSVETWILALLNNDFEVDYTPGEAKQALDEGKWVTIRGVHVMIDPDGRITKGPAHMIGKSPDELKADPVAAVKDTLIAKAKAVFTPEPFVPFPGDGPELPEEKAEREEFPRSVERGMEQLAVAGLPQDFAEQCPLAQIYIDREDCEKEGARAMYEIASGKMELGNHNVMPETVVHEFGHHVMAQLDDPNTIDRLGWREKALFSQMVKASDEYDGVVLKVSELTGVPLDKEGTFADNYDRLYSRVAGTSLTGPAARFPTVYALYDKREWFAETFERYVSEKQPEVAKQMARIGMSPLQRIAPETYKLIDGVMKGGQLRHKA
jgi:hypothetical protein